MSQSYWVYILGSQSGVLYVGVTRDIAKRVHIHKSDLIDGFTKKYKVHKLLYVEHFDRIEDAIHREKCLKRWKRDWKIRLIGETNPEFRDISGELG